MTLGEKIKDLRKKANITLKAIATLFNISIDELLDYKKETLGDIVLEKKYSLEGIKKEGEYYV